MTNTHTPARMNTVFAPEDVRRYYEDAIVKERAEASRYFRAAITYKGGYQEYNRLMDMYAAAQARSMALWQEMDNAIVRAEVLTEKVKEFECIKASVWIKEDSVELKRPEDDRTTFRRVIVRKLRPTLTRDSI